MRNFFMKRLIALAFILPTQALAQVSTEHYVEKCEVLGQPSQCEVVDTRTQQGGLDAREIRDRKFGYVFKQKYVQGQGFMSWDSYSLNTYKFPYQVRQNGESVVSPHLVIDEISWD